MPKAAAMRMTQKLICALALAVAGAAAWADVSRDEAAAAAQRATGGRVLAVERAQSDNRPVWRVKVLTPSGEVRVVLVDAASGRTF